MIAVSDASPVNRVIRIGKSTRFVLHRRWIVPLSVH